MPLSIFLITRAKKIRTVFIVLHQNNPNEPFENLDCDFSQSRFSNGSFGRIILMGINKQLLNKALKKKIVGNQFFYYNFSCHIAFNIFFFDPQIFSLNVHIKN